MPSWPSVMELEGHSKRNRLTWNRQAQIIAHSDQHRSRLQAWVWWQNTAEISNFLPYY